MAPFTSNAPRFRAPMASAPGRIFPRPSRRPCSSSSTRSPARPTSPLSPFARPPPASPSWRLPTGRPAGTRLSRWPERPPAGSAARSLLQLDVPVGDIEEILPDLAVLGPEHHRDDRPPFRPGRLADQAHAGLVGQAVRLARIAPHARADDVLPGRLPAVVARDDMVEVELLAGKDAA